MKTIPYHERPIIGPPIKTRCVAEWTHTDGRKICVNEVKDCPDFYVIITAPIDAESESELCFRLSPEGARGLALALFQAIGRESV